MKFGRSILRHLNFNLRRRIDGGRVWVPVMAGLKTGVSGERFLLDILRHFLPKLEGAVVDVGANLGQTLCKVRLADPGRVYYGFEPNAACCAYLENLVRINGWKDVWLFPCGLSDRTQILPLHVPPDETTDGSGSFLPAILPDGRREIELSEKKYGTVFAYSQISDLIEERIAFLKIDVEGTELEVVRGMTETIRRDRPVVALELIPDESLIERHEETAGALRSLGYDLFSVRSSSDGHWAGLTPLPSYVLPERPSTGDYLAIPQGRSALLDEGPGSGPPAPV